MVNAIAVGCKKNILIFNTYPQAPSPIHVIKASQFGGEVNSSIPVVVCYDGNHYESLHPNSQKDVDLTRDLCESYCQATYAFDSHDIKYLISAPCGLNPFSKPWPIKPSNFPARIKPFTVNQSAPNEIVSTPMETRVNPLIQSINQTEDSNNPQIIVKERKLSQKEKAVERKQKQRSDPNKKEKERR